MTTKLAWESVEAMVAEQRRNAARPASLADDADEAARLIAALWEWAAGRESEVESTA
jgi:hypothetical protein